MDSKRLLQTGQLFSLRPHTRFVDFPAHSHNCVEMVFMLSGSTTHLLNGTDSLVLRENELLILNQYATHSVQRAGQNDIALNFLILPAFFGTAFDVTGPDTPLGRFLSGVLGNGPGDISFLHFPVSGFLPVQNLLENLIWGILNQPDNSKINQASLHLLFLHLFSCAREMQSAPARRGSHFLVAKALREIEENYKNANFTELAERCHTSLSYMSRTVTRATGRGFKELLREKRLSRAAQLLTRTKLPVSEIIEAVGYENTSYFYTIFKKRYGVSPNQYRADAAKTKE